VKRVLLLLIMMVILMHPLFADYEPYRADEFPQWSIKLRRAETLLFGSLPITVGVTSLAYSTAQLMGAPQLHSDPLRESLAVIGIAGALSLAVVLADYIIGEMQN
jgi:hypothetical protein